MKFLLDTHVFLWALLDTKKLSSTAGTSLEQADEILISPVSLWEISIKYGLGKLTLNNTTPEELLEKGTETGFQILDCDTNVIASSYKLSQISTLDPFDRMLIWQAMQDNLTLITKDKTIQEYKQFGLKTLW